MFEVFTLMFLCVQLVSFLETIDVYAQKETEV